MTEYYTTSELAHARLAILHGFEGCVSDVNSFGEKYHKALMEYMNNNINGTHFPHPDPINYAKKMNGFYLLADAWAFPRTPHNVGLMEPKKKDIGVTTSFNGNQYPVWCSGKEWRDYGNGGDSYPLSDGTIIYRNNQPFPVWDKERV